jgi:hypothetical protein
MLVAAKAAMNRRTPTHANAPPMQRGAPMTSCCAATRRSGSALFGVRLSLEEARRHPRLSEFWAVTDWLMLNDELLHEKVFHMRRPVRVISLSGSIVRSSRLPRLIGALRSMRRQFPTPSWALGTQLLSMVSEVAVSAAGSSSYERLGLLLSPRWWRLGCSAGPNGLGAFLVGASDPGLETLLDRQGCAAGGLSGLPDCRLHP